MTPIPVSAAILLVALECVLFQPLQKALEAESTLLQKDAASASHSSAGSEVVDEGCSSAVEYSSGHLAEQGMLLEESCGFLTVRQAHA